jgi:hypothetical protein
MLSAVGHILPVAIAVALSSVPIMTVLLILLSPNRARTSLPFLIGWTLGILIVVSIFSLGAFALPDAPKGSDVAAGVVQIVIGAALVIFSFILWRRAARHPKSTDVPKWLGAVGSLGRWPVFGIALVLNVRPKAILLAAAASVAIRSENLSVGSASIVIGIYTVIGMSTVAIPVIYALAAPVKAEPRLTTVRDWIVKNNRILTILIMLMVGFVIVGNGLTKL